MVAANQFCIITTNFYPQSVGGIETFISQFTNYLRSNSISSTVISLSSLPAGDGLDPIHFPMVPIPGLGFLPFSLLFVPAAVLKIVKLHSKSKIRLIYAVDTGYAGLAALIGGRILRRPVVIHEHGRRSEVLRNVLRVKGDRRTWLLWALELTLDRFVGSTARAFIAVSDDIASFLVSMGVPRDRIHVISSAVSEGAYSESFDRNFGAQLGLPKRSFVVGYLGRVEQSQKGLAVLLRAYARFSEKERQTSFLLIAGEGPDRQLLQELVKRRKMVNVRLLGYLRDSHSFLKNIDVFVLPSFQEGSPIVLLEAMAAGCTILASDIPGVREIARECSILVAPGDDQRLCDELLHLEADPRLRRELAERARKESKKYSTGVIMPKVLAICSEALQNANGRG